MSETVAGGARQLFLQCYKTNGREQMTKWNCTKLMTCAVVAHLGSARDAESEMHNVSDKAHLNHMPWNRYFYADSVTCFPNIFQESSVSTVFLRQHGLTNNAALNTCWSLTFTRHEP